VSAAPVVFTCPLPAADLRFESMSASSGLSALGEMQLNLISQKPDLKPEDLLGKTATVAVLMPDESTRYFHGYVTRFGIGAYRGHHFGYQATIRPWLWFLSRTSDCRIYQDLTVPEIVTKVFEDHSVSNFEFKTFRSYRKWTYCVQYRETDFNFIARLLEHEGIYWYFEHSEDEHKLILVDSQSAHDAAPGCESLPYLKAGQTAEAQLECVSQWSFAREIQSGHISTTSYDFERPSTSLQVDTIDNAEHAESHHQVFDYQGDYIQTADGTQLTENRLDEVQTRFEQLRGSSNAHGICVGHLLKLTRHPRDDQNAQYLITQTTIDAQIATGQNDGSGQSFRCAFSAIPASQQFRPPRRTPKPFVQGPQTAVVVGPSGEEIFTDKYGRVKVQFHWDRYGTKNEKSSCWTRVSSPWAGKSFGFVQVPRIGQEVVVDFLEGDPDQPLITGRVYNAEQMPPWELPANATQSGVLTRSSKGGAYANANALRFEDKKGAEQLWLHAEKNQDIEVENDETHWVGHDRTKTVDHDETVHVKHDRTETVDNNETITIGVDRTEKVGNNEKISIGVNRTEDVGANEDIKIGVNRTEQVGANESITIGSNRTITIGGSETATVMLQRTHTVGINETITVGAAQEVSIGALQAVTIGAAQTITVGGNQSTSVSAARSIAVGTALSTKVGADEAREVGGGRATKIGKDDAYKIGKNLVIDAGDSVTIKTGDASITMKKDGTISIKGKDISIKGSGKINVKADSDCVIKGSKIGAN
jgi:type VI secretion system secreted protein VgrG